jgi:predicted MFS family arabinose efflux permease
MASITMPIEPITSGKNPPPSAMRGALLVIMPCLPMAGILLIAQVLPRLQAAFASTPHAAELAPIALAIPALTQGLTSFGAGWLADRLGRAKLLLVSLAFYGITGIAPLFLNDLHAIILDRALMGVMEGGIMAASTALIGDYYTGQQRARMFSLQTSLASGTAIILAILGGVLGDISWRAPFFFYVVGFAVLILSALYVRDVPGRLQTTGPAQKLPVGKIWLPCAFSAIIAFGTYVPQIETPFLLTRVGIVAPHVIGLVTALANGGIMLGTFIFIKLVRFDVAGQGGRMNLLILGLLTSGLIILGTAGNGWMVTLGAFIASMGGGVGLPCMINRTIRPLLMSQYGRGVGLWQAFFAMSAFFHPLLVLALAHYLGGLGQGVAALGMICLMLAALQMSLLRRGAPPQDRPA